MISSHYFVVLHLMFCNFFHCCSSEELQANYFFLVKPVHTSVNYISIVFIKGSVHMFLVGFLLYVYLSSKFQ